MGSLLFLSENSEGGERLHPVRQNVLRTIARTLATMYQLLLRPIGTNAEVQKDTFKQLSGDSAGTDQVQKGIMNTKAQLFF